MGTRMICFLLPFLLVACRIGDKPQTVSRLSSRPDARASLAVPPEGFVDAEIHSTLGVYRRPVLIANGRLDCVQWSSQQCIPFHGTLFADGTASGTMQNGDVIKVTFLD